MIDYLEALLDEQKLEENQQALEWKWPTPLPSTDNTVQVSPLSGAESFQTKWGEAGAMETAEKSAQRRIDLARKAVSAPSITPFFEQRPNAEQAAAQVSKSVPETEPQTSFPAEALTAEIIRLRRAIRQADIQVSRRAVSGTDTAAASSSVSWGARTPLSRAENYAALVDAAFARDARRYDGPLGLL